MNRSFNQVKNWLINSGIFISDRTDPNFGGVYSFFDKEKNSFSFIYPEITGYYASTMRFLYSHEPKSEYIERSMASCNWLIKLFDKHNGIIQGISSTNKTNPFVYSFDTAVCAKGMFDCYNISGDDRYLIYGKKLNSWILDKAVNSDATINALYNLESSKFESNHEVWYKKYGCLHIKCVMSLLVEYQITKENSLLETSINIAKNISFFTNNDGSIRLHKDDDVINIHTLCYALEGLLYAFYITKENQFLKIVINALNWCDKKIMPDGSIDLWFNSKYHSKSSYPIAQVMRLKILVSKLTNLIDIKTNQRLLIFLNSLQSFNSDPKLEGCFYEEFYKSLFKWKKRLKANSWASMFALQAIYWNTNFSKINFDDEIQLLY